MRRLLLALCLFVAAQAQGAELRAFGSGAMARLQAERQGQPFILALWSVDCPHCKDNLRRLAALAQSHPKLDLVVVNTDNLGESKTIAAMLAKLDLPRRDTWVFGDAAPERLRFEIDKRWSGELPRTYLFDADHTSHAFSGPLDEPLLRQWLARNGVDRPRPKP